MFRKPNHPFRFGVINEQPLLGAEWIEHVQRIENLGYDIILIRDHVLPDFFGHQYGPIAALATAAAVTIRLRIGTLVLSNDYRHPVILAKELATLDALSGGRLEVGIGAGWLHDEYQAMGIPYDRAGTRVDRLEESLKILSATLSAMPFAVRGEHYQVAELDSFPKPVQQPHPPLLIGAGKQRMLTLAGREANIVSILTTSVASGTVEDDPHERLADATEEKLSWIRDGAGERYAQLELNLIPTLLISDDRQATAQALIDSRDWDTVTIEDVLDMPSLLIGSINEIAETMIQRRERFGISYYVVSDSSAHEFAPLIQLLAAK